MAFEDTLTAITNTVVGVDGMHDNVGKQTAFLKMLMANGPKKQGGERIQINVMTDHMNGGIYGVTDEFDTSRKDFETAAYWEWCQMYAGMAFHGRDKIRNAGAARIRDYVKDMKMNATKTMAKQLSEQFFAIGNGGVYPNMDNLDHLLDDVSGTLNGVNAVVGTLDKGADSAFFAGNIKSGGGSGKGINYSNWTRFGTGPGHDGMEQANLIVTHSLSFDQALVALQPQQRYQQGSSNSLLAGFRAFEFNGATVVADNHVSNDASHTNNRAYFLNMNTIHLVVSSLENMVTRPFRWLEKQNSWASQVLVACNLICTEPRKNAIIYNYDYTSVVDF